MVTELQNTLPWLQINRKRCRGYRLTESVAVVTELQNTLHDYRVS